LFFHKEIAEEVEQERKKEEEKILEKTKVHKEIDYLKQITEKIRKLAIEEMERFKKSYIKKIKEKKETANKQAKIIMKNIQKENKDLPYKSCISPKLKGFDDKTYVFNHCKKYYGEHVNISNNTTK